MSAAQNLRLLDVDQLADACADHTARFFNRTAHDPGYCYELFRRAIVDRNNYAWDKVYRQYESLVAGWVKRHSGLSAAGEDVDYIVNCAFERLWAALLPEKFGEFGNVAGLLRYLQMCAHSVIVDHTRSTHLPTLSLEESGQPPAGDFSSVEEKVTDELERRRLWEKTLGLMQDDRESLVLRCSFVYNLKPSEIYDKYSNQFESNDQVYRIKRNLLNRLRRNPALQEFLVLQSPS
jgi:DNA-directed RNA polymerase specialized sigma24 family protein